jgi:hypothetical protein
MTDNLLAPLMPTSKSLIKLVTETSHGVREKAVVQENTFPDLSDDRVFNPFIKSLTTAQREMLAQMLHAERVAAIHDALAVLTWWILTGGVGLTFRGERMPVELSGEGLHGDYIGRLDGWQWPKDDTQPAPQ